MTKKKFTENKVHKPHDKTFHAAMKIYDVARDAMRACVPEPILKRLDLTKIRPYTTNMVSPQLKDFAADIFYEVPLLDAKDSFALALLHFEQQHKPDPVIALRVWQYLLLGLLEYAENHKDKPLPIPVPVIIYTGKDKFNHSTYLFDLFGDNKELAEETFYREIKLVEVCQMDDGDIKKHHLFGILELAYKYRGAKKFEQFLDEIFPWLQIERQATIEYVRIIVDYVYTKIKTDSSSDLELLRRKIDEHLSGEFRDEAMTIAQQLRQDGIQQGIEYEKQILAKKMLKKHLDFSMISEITELSIQQLKLIDQDETLE